VLVSRRVLAKTDLRPSVELGGGGGDQGGGTTLTSGILPQVNNPMRRFAARCPHRVPSTREDNSPDWARRTRPCHTADPKREKRANRGADFSGVALFLFSQGWGSDWAGRRTGKHSSLPFLADLLREARGRGAEAGELVSAEVKNELPRLLGESAVEAHSRARPAPRQISVPVLRSEGYRGSSRTLHAGSDAWPRRLAPALAVPAVPRGHDVHGLGI
jgi:hypothetical protein